MERELESKKVVTCLIISTNQVVYPYPVYPLGAAYITAAMSRKGHQVYHFDLLADGGIQELEQFLVGKYFDLVGISIRNLDTVDSSRPDEYLAGVLETVDCVRRKLDTILVLGGAAFSIMPVNLMDLLQADYGVVGEGEVAMSWLAEEIAAGRKPAQKILSAPLKRCNGHWPKMTESTVKYYSDHGGMLNVQTKRGCSYRCVYCSYPTIEGRKIRYRDPEDVAAEVASLQSRYNIKYLFFADSVFNDPEKRYLEIAEAMIRKKVSLPWSAFFRPDNISRDELKLLKKSGLAAMEFGTDASTDETLMGLKKNFCFDDVLHVHELAVSEDISCAHFIMFGGPNEDEETLRKGLLNVEKLHNSIVFAFLGIRILPGTDLYDQSIRDGVITRKQKLISPYFYYSPKISREKIEEKVKKSFGSRMDRIYPSHQFDERIALLHKMGQVGPLWDLLLKQGRR